MPTFIFLSEHHNVIDLFCLNIFIFIYVSYSVGLNELLCMWWRNHRTVSSSTIRSNIRFQSSKASPSSTALWSAPRWQLPIFCFHTECIIDDSLWGVIRYNSYPMPRQKSLKSRWPVLVQHDMASNIFTGYLSKKKLTKQNAKRGQETLLKRGIK